MADIHVAAVVLRDDAGRILVVRKQGTQRYMLPGGKIEPGEAPDQTAIREIAEEVGLALEPSRLEFLGEWTAPAANEPGLLVHGHVYAHPWVGGAAPSAEIADLQWLLPDDMRNRDDLAPLLVTRVLPALSGEPWQGRSRMRIRGWLAALGIVVAIGGTGMVLVLPDTDGGAVPPAFALIPLAAGLFILWASIVFTTVVLVMDAQGAHMAFGPWGRPRRDVPWSAITGVSTVDVRALPWGGWGYRWSSKGTAAVMRRGPGIQFDLADGRILVVTVDDAEAGAAAARQWWGPATGG